jgi:hypothetical protein
VGGEGRDVLCEYLRACAERRRPQGLLWCLHMHPRPYHGRAQRGVARVCARSRERSAHLLHAPDDDVSDVSDVARLQRADPHQLVHTLDDPGNIRHELPVVLIRAVAPAEREWGRMVSSVPARISGKKILVVRVSVLLMRT